MNNVVAFPVPNLTGWPQQTMSERERKLLVRTIEYGASELTYPLNRILPCFAEMVRDYPMEDVVLKDLHPCGYLLSCSYPSYGLHWMLRVEGRPQERCDATYPVSEVQGVVERAVEAMNCQPRVATFLQRFMEGIREWTLCQSSVWDGRVLVISGLMRASLFDYGGPDPHVPFTMVLSKR